MSDKLFRAARILRDAAKTDFKTLPGGSVSAFLNTLDSDTRFALVKEYKAREHLHDTGGRIDSNGFLKPFAPRIDLPPVPKELDKTIDRLRTEEITQGLDSRMGTSQQTERIINEQPTSLRDLVEASIDHHSQE
jgi:hypothetical protein